MKVVVKIHNLILGGKEWHMEEKLYNNGDVIDVPDMEAAKKLGTSVRIIQEPIIDTPVEVNDVVDAEVESIENIVEDVDETQVVEDAGTEKKKAATRRRR